MKKRYELDGVTVVRNLYGYDGFFRLYIKTDEDGLKKILDEPRQDYTNYGGLDILYAEFDVYEVDVTEDDEFIIKRFHKKPFTIKDGEIPDDFDIKEAWKEMPFEVTY